MKIKNLVLIQIFIMLYILFYLFVSKYYTGNFSQSLYGKIILFVLIIFMIVSLKKNRLLLLFFLLVVFISFKDYIVETFSSDFLRSEIKAKDKEISFLTKKTGELENKTTELELKLNKEEDKTRTAESEKKTLETNHQLYNANTEAQMQENSSEECEYAKNIMKEKKEYSSDIQGPAKEKIKECINKGEMKAVETSNNEILPNNVGFEMYNNMKRKKNLANLKCKGNIPYLNNNRIRNNSNLKYMIDNFNFINSSCNPCLKGCKYEIKDKIETESRLIPVNTRYFN